MKILVGIIFIILLLPIAYSENLNEYESLDMDFSLNSVLNIDYPSRIDSVEVDLSLFPRDIGSYQSVTDLRLRAEPEAEIIAEEDSFVYKWKDLEEKTLEFGISANIKSRSKLEIILDKVKFPILSKENLDYTKEAEHIDFNDKIRRRADEITKGETDLYLVAYKLAEWIRENVEYNLNTLTAEADKPSSWVLENRYGVCDEITNLFISFLRSLNVPARFVSGVVYTNEEDGWGNHGWAEVYFPGYGWVPFDVTFGQYGWLGASHIKLKDSFDSGDASIKYSWKSTGADINAEGIDIETILVEKGEKIKPRVSIDVEVLKDQVGFGSYSLVEVNVRNLQPYYASTILYLTKASLLVGDNSRRVLLKPGEEKKVYWIIGSPVGLEEGFIYKSIIEVKSIFGAIDYDEIVFSEAERVYTLNEIEERYDALVKDEESEDFDFNCVLDSDYYYRYENADVECVLRNKGNFDFNNLIVCLEDACRNVDLLKYEEERVYFSLPLINYGEDNIILEVRDNDVKKVYLDFRVLEVPGVRIAKVDVPEILDYDEETNLTFYLYSGELLEDVRVRIYPIKEFNIENFEGYKEFVLPFNGKDLDLSGDILIDIYYDNENIKEKINVDVLNVPWYGKIKVFFRELFRF